MNCVPFEADGLGNATPTTRYTMPNSVTTPSHRNLPDVFKVVWPSMRLRVKSRQSIFLPGVGCADHPRSRPPAVFRRLLAVLLLAYSGLASSNSGKHLCLAACPGVRVCAPTTFYPWGRANGPST